MRAVKILLVGLVVATSGGCVAAAVGGAAGATGLAYVWGDVERVYPYPLDVVWNASLSAMAELELTAGHQSKDQLKGRIERYTAAGDRVRIKLTSQGSATELNVRVNTFGDKSMSRVILQKIEKYLPSQGVAPPPANTSPVPVPMDSEGDAGTEKLPNLPEIE